MTRRDEVLPDMTNDTPQPRKARQLAPLQEKVLRFIAVYGAENDLKRPSSGKIAAEVHCSKTIAHYTVLRLINRCALIVTDKKHIRIADWVDLSLEHPLGIPNYRTPFDKEKQFRNQKGRCYYCGQKFANGKFEVDHIIPVSRGGSDEPDNKVLACRECNQDKSNRCPHEWAKGGRLL